MENVWNDFSLNLNKLLEPNIYRKPHESLTEYEDKGAVFSLPKVHYSRAEPRSSSLHAKYGELLSRVGNRAEKLNVIHSSRQENERVLPRSPNRTKIHLKKLKPRKGLYKSFQSNKNRLSPLQVHGATFGFKRASQNPYIEKIQDFLRKTQTKYEDLYRKLDKDGKNVIIKANATELLGSSLSSLFMKSFDPFKTGLITKKFFFSVLAVYEYSSYGMQSHPEFLIDIFDTKSLRSLRNQIYHLKDVFCKYSDGLIMKREEFLRVLSYVSNMNFKDLISIMGIGSSVNFGQFLMFVPYLIENYKFN